MNRNLENLLSKILPYRKLWNWHLSLINDSNFLAPYYQIDKQLFSQPPNMVFAAIFALATAAK